VRRVTARPASWKNLVLAAVAAAVLVACGGSGGGDAGGASGGSSTPAVIEKPSTRSEAARFLTQASFGPTDAAVERVMSIGYEAWIDEQLALPAVSHRGTWEAYDAALKAANASASAGQSGVYYSFWKQALAGDGQLRQRVAFALSEIFVISMQGSSVGENPRAVTAYMDLLADKGLGKYRDLLEAVSLHPQMGVYLSHLRNRKADAKTGRVPDENYAREVMQLFSIGLVQLNPDGSVKTQAGQPVETYGPADIAGLAKVFTGWSWDCPDGPRDNCFQFGQAESGPDPDKDFKPMVGYAAFHSTEEKSFLGTTIPAQTRADPYASLKTALDALAAHPNVGPFIGKQLIQRLVTSNPSPAYVKAVSDAFSASGGDMKAMVKAVLMHPEARQSSNTAGKLREPVLRLAAYLRAFPHSSDSGAYKLDNTDDAGTALGQTAMRSPSVFNFFRPGYVAPGSAAAAQGLVAPELQIAHETSAAGYVNFMRDVVQFGAGVYDSTRQRRDLQPDFSAELALADQPSALVDRVNERLMYGTMPAALKTEIQGAVDKIVIPALNSSGSNQAAINTAKRNRVNAAIFLALVSPEFAVQK
jgi:uncharacterized protein (DUF1800 family)